MKHALIWLALWMLWLWTPSTFEVNRLERRVQSIESAPRCRCAP